MICRTDFLCYLCGGTKKVRVIDVDGHRVSKCSACGLGFLDSVAMTEQSNVYYGEDFYVENRMIQDPAKAIRDNLSRVKFVQRFKDSGRLVDIGCGLGYFLAAAQQQGFSVCGIEGSQWALNYMNEHFVFPVYHGPIEEIAIDTESFDVCTLWHVVEHLPDPLKTLRRIWDVLKRNGVLIIETRNYMGFDARIQREKWNGWSLPYHLWHFTPESLCSIVKKSDFRILRLKVHRSAYVKNKIRSIPILKALRNPIACLFPGSNITVIAHKPK